MPVVISTWDGCPLDTALSVTYTASDGPAPNATAGADYPPTTGLLTFPAGTANGFVMYLTVPIINDTIVEANEHFTITLSSPLGGTISPTGVTHVVTILDDDPLASFVDAAGAVYENAGPANAVIKLRSLS